MKCSNITRRLTMLFVLSWTLPLAAADAVAKADAHEGINRSEQASLSDAKDDNAPATTKSKAKILLCCGGGSCGYGGYGGYGGYRGYGYSYAAPYRSAPIAQPATYAAQPAAAPVAAAAPAPSQPNAVITLSNPEADTVAYTLNGSRFDMNPGYGQKLTDRPSWTLEFDRGGNFGTARYTLIQGAYKFVATDRGWDVVKDVEGTASSNGLAPPTPGYSFDSYARGR